MSRAALDSALPRRFAAATAAAALLTSLAFVAAPVLSSAARGPVKTIARSVATSVLGERDVALPIAASHVVLHWQGNPNATVGVAFAAEPGAFGPAQAVERDDDGPDAAPAGHSSTMGPFADDTFGQVVVAGGARFVRITSDRPIARLTVEALDTRGSALQAAADAVIALSGTGSAAAAETKPAVISRAAWGADESYRFDSGGHEKFPPSFYPLQKLVVHHTAGSNNDPNPAATIRAIYYDHAIIRGYGDIDYNFLIDAQGRVYEGRHSRAYAGGEPITGEDLAGNPVRAGHARGYNPATIGISLLGNFTSVQPPAAQRTALIRMLAWEAERHGLDPLGSSTYLNPESGTSLYLPNIAGHRNVNVTGCPGDFFYSTFALLRQQVASEIAVHSGAAVDHTAPTATLSPMLTPTGGSTMTFGLPFAEPVTGLAPEDFSVGGTSAGWAVTDVTGSASTYTVVVHSDAPTDGTVVLSLAAGSVTDVAGNAGPPAVLQATADFATDTTAPTVTIWWTPHRAALNVTTFDLTATFSEPVLGLSSAHVQLGGTSDAATPWSFSQSAILGSGPSYGFSVEAASPANGTLTVTIPAGATTDPAGNPNEAAQMSVVIDRTAPTTSAPTTTIRSGATLGGTVPARVSWTGADSGGAGIASYDVERSTDGAGYVVIAAGVAGPAIGVTLAAGHSYRFAVRARDGAGNLSAWRAASATSAVVLQDSSTALHWSSGWHVASSTAYSAGTARYASTAGASMTTTFTGRGVGFVTSLGARGQVRVYVDGSFVTTLDLRSATSAYRRIAWTRAWGASATHTLKLVVVGTAARPRVDVDAIVVLR
ncbi:MAG TPA: N-acetylmuramoyl-L-alanine amidase [Candidatus Limnocylindrales bacterium]